MEAYNRANNFLRATEVHSFTTEHRALLSKCIKANLEQIDIHNKLSPKTHSERIEIVETLFKTLMDYPEFLSKFPKFRIIALNKVDEIISDIKILNLPESQILSDTKYYMKMISARPDYIEYNCFIHGLPNLPSLAATVATVPKPLEQKNSMNTVNHSYNLRPRNKRMRYD